MPTPILLTPTSTARAEDKPEMAQLTRTVSPRRFAILRAFDKEKSSERQEAQTEASERVEEGRGTGAEEVDGEMMKKRGGSRRRRG